MDAFRKGWFTELPPDEFGIESECKKLKSDGKELGELLPGQAFSLKVDEVLFEGRSKFQNVLVLKTKCWGNALVLDGIIQCTEVSLFEIVNIVAICRETSLRIKKCYVTLRYSTILTRKRF
jgi:spermidine synthase